MKTTGSEVTIYETLEDYLDDKGDDEDDEFFDWNRDEDDADES